MNHLAPWFSLREFDLRGIAIPSFQGCTGVLVSKADPSSGAGGWQLYARLPEFWPKRCARWCWSEGFVMSASSFGSKLSDASNRDRRMMRCVHCAPTLPTGDLRYRWTGCEWWHSGEWIPTPDSAVLSGCWSLGGNWSWGWLGPLEQKDF